VARSVNVVAVRFCEHSWIVVAKIKDEAKKFPAFYGTLRFITAFTTV
jgi:hypothetical protein